jgi:hypothetical protein
MASSKEIIHINSRLNTTKKQCRVIVWGWIEK